MRTPRPMAAMLLLAALFAPREAAAQGKVPLQRYCPVFTSEPVFISEGWTARYRGIKVRLSSREAYIRFLRDPDAYADPAILPQLEGLTLPERELKQVYCPVFRDRKVSGKDPYVWYEGRRVYLFNEGAVAKWNADPQRYLDLELLPQLKKQPPTGKPPGAAQVE